MGLPSLDLNLLVALHALLAERNVTRAGERIGLSQPATSAALARLRRHFGDELLTRVGGHYELTALAESLLEQSDIALRYVESTFTARPLFDASVSDREFTLIMSDYALSVIGTALARLLQERAPDVRLRIAPLSQRVVDDAPTALRVNDAMVLPPGYFTELPSRALFTDDWVVVGSRRPGAGPRTLTTDDLSAARWVLIYDAPTQFTPPDKTLSLLGIRRRADIVVETFANVPYLVAAGDRLALLPRRMARLLPPFQVEVIEPPIDLPTLTEHVWWHPNHGPDPGHRWLIQLVVAAAAASETPPDLG